MNKFTGSSGFLMSELIPHLTTLPIDDCIYHFAGPSSIDEFTEESTIGMIDNVKELLVLNYNKIIFASSQGVIERSSDYNQELYNTSKKTCEELIKKSGKQYIILRIPRVYGSSRKKGLMQAIRENRIINWDKYINYYDIKDFIMETIDFLLVNTFNVTKEYNQYLKRNTIKEIKEIYCLEMKEKDIF